MDHEPWAPQNNPYGGFLQNQETDVLSLQLSYLELDGTHTEVPGNGVAG